VVATVTVNANTDTQSGVDGTDSTSTVLGNPTTECFVFGPRGASVSWKDERGKTITFTSSDWDSGARSKVMGAIAQLARSRKYMEQYLCPGGPVTLYQVKADFGGGLTSGRNVFLFNACLSPQSGCMNYTLAHETGHVINNGPTDLFDQFHGQGISRPPEGMLWTYVNGYTEREDFAETFGAYVAWRSYRFRGSNGRTGNLNYPVEYPRHYQFAKLTFGIEY
jgi:hypothetical protein